MLTSIIPGRSLIYLQPGFRVDQARLGISQHLLHLKSIHSVIIHYSFWVYGSRFRIPPAVRLQEGFLVFKLKAAFGDLTFLCWAGFLTLVSV